MALINQAWGDRLNELLDWREYEPGKWEWKCGKDGDRLGLARQAASDIGRSFDDLMQEADIHACCDCEIIFNGTCGE